MATLGGSVMVKSSKSLHVRSKELREPSGGQSNGAVVSEAEGLPFDCCALSLAPWATPVLAVIGGQGYVFELSQIAVYLKKHRVDPIQHKPFSKEDLISLKWSRNDKGQLQCPITLKTFNKFSHIVAIKETGNVYSFEAVSQLCLRPGVWQDPLTSKPFAGKSSIIALQDPHGSSREKHSSPAGSPLPTEIPSPSKTKSGLKTQQKIIAQESTGPHIRMSGIAERIMQKANAVAKKRALEEAKSAPIKLVNQSNEQSTFSSGLCAASLTSSAISPETSNARQAATAAELEGKRYRAIRHLKKKGYVRLETSHGDLNLEIYCNFTPRTAENFLGLAEQGYYDGTVFHRLIPEFMIQGGDPTGTGRGGQSLWGKPFEDELDPGNAHLKHSQRGLLSMANSGPNTNRSQFFITFGPSKHLDRKHTVFGRVVGGLEVLNKIESIPTDKDDRPTEPVIIRRTLVFVNPIKDYDIQHQHQHQLLPSQEKSATLQSKNNMSSVSSSSASTNKEARKTEERPEPAAKRQRLENASKEPKTPPARTNKGVVFQNFDAW